MTIKQIISKYRYSIALLLGFIFVENVAWIIEPTFFGKLLDVLIEHFYDHEKVNYLIPLLVWILVYLINVVGGTLHRLYNGGIYSGMYAEVAAMVISESEAHCDPHSKMLVRAELVKEYIAFFKDRLPEMFWTFIGQTDNLPDLMESLGSIKDLDIRFERDLELTAN